MTFTGSLWKLADGSIVIDENKEVVACDDCPCAGNLETIECSHCSGSTGPKYFDITLYDLKEGTCADADPSADCSDWNNTYRVPFLTEAQGQCLWELRNPGNVFPDPCGSLDSPHGVFVGIFVRDGDYYVGVNIILRDGDNLPRNAGYWEVNLGSENPDCTEISFTDLVPETIWNAACDFSDAKMDINIGFV